MTKWAETYGTCLSKVITNIIQIDLVDINTNRILFDMSVMRIHKCQMLNTIDEAGSRLMSCQSHGSSH